MKTNRQITLGLVCILLFSFLFRLYKINQLPLFGDEVDVGYQAYSLLKTGKDYKGNFLPTYIQSFSESRAPLLMYFSVPSIAILGLNEIGVRFTPIIFGVLSILFLFLLIKQITNNPKLALISAIFLSLSPWHFHYSRTAFEVTLLLTLLLAGTYYFLNKKYFLSIFLFCLTFYTYNTANIFTPLLVIYLYITNLKSFNIKKTITLSVFGLILILPIIYNILFGSAANRFGLISIFNSPQLIGNIISKRLDYSSSKTPVENLFHNRPIIYVQEFSKNYIASLSPTFLFVTGDNNTRHNVEYYGLILLPLIIPFLFGLTKLKKYPLMSFWLFTAPIASCLTMGGGHHPTRLFIVLPALIFFTTIGFFQLQKNIKYLVLISFGFYIILFSHEYFTHYPKESAQNYNFGYKSLIESLPKNYNRLFISNSNYISLPQYLFYTKHSPAIFQKELKTDQEVKNIFLDMDGFRLNDKVYFINNWHQNNDIFTKIETFAKSGDVFLLFQKNEIPGDWDLSLNSKENYSTIKTIKLPNYQLFGQIIQKQ